MNNFRYRTLWMLLLFLFAIFIGTGSLAYTRYLVNILKTEERKKVELWAEATLLIISADTAENISFPSSIIENNNTVPVILTDESDRIIATKNFDDIRINDPGYLLAELEKIKKRNPPIEIDLEYGHRNFIYYKDSIILTQLTYYPYIQFAVIILFILVAYLGFSTSRKAANNQVWISMSKETAHQLGTPTSSLAGWVEILNNKYPDLSVTREIALDVERLEKITERFSRIGSRPVLKFDDITEIISRTVEYLKKRTSSKVKFILDQGIEKPVRIQVNATLLEWVIENISKNAIDAMEGQGVINYRICESEKSVVIDITDTGKGIPRKYFKKIFNPGYSTKQRGWGLGLSLTKRIIEEFHKGRVYVRSSEPGKGSCIRIVLYKG